MRRVSLSVKGMDIRWAVCRNLTDPQTVSMPNVPFALRSAVDCGSFDPFTAREGDDLRLSAMGTNFGPALSGSVRNVFEGAVECLNETNGDRVKVLVVGNAE